MEDPSIKFRRTQRGFALYEFTDLYGASCSIQKSSLATKDAIWLGTGQTRMHLDKELVVKLIPVLLAFLETGEVEELPEKS